jgi:hypothetical protein
MALTTACGIWQRPEPPKTEATLLLFARCWNTASPAHLEDRPAGPVASVSAELLACITGEGLRYTIFDEWLPKILGWNKSEASGRFDAAMAADGLFNLSQRLKK